MLATTQESETKLIKPRARLSIGGKPQRAAKSMQDVQEDHQTQREKVKTPKTKEIKKSVDVHESVLEKIVKSPDQVKPKWDDSIRAPPEKSKTNLTPFTSRIEPRNQLRFASPRSLISQDGEFKMPEVNYKKMYFAEKEKVKELERKIAALEIEKEDLKAFAPILSHKFVPFQNQSPFMN